MIDAKVIADSVCKTRITTMIVTMPKFLVAQFNTHRAFSRNSASSRAIPSARIRQQVVETPYIPSVFPTAQRGMSGGPPLDDATRAVEAWLAARDAAVEHHKALEAMGVAKEVCNRVVEPWMLTSVLVTSTEWDNFFAQRLPGAGAQHEMGLIAEKMKQVLDKSRPRRLLTGQWHLPFVDDGAVDEPGHRLAQSVARCARVSYQRHERQSDYAEDLRRHDQLRDDKHWSPFEHIAEAMPGDVRCRNFRGWYQYRSLLDGGKQ
jgi:thymidylate synthase ThyX